MAPARLPLLVLFVGLLILPAAGAFRVTEVTGVMKSIGNASYRVTEAVGMPAGASGGNYTVTYGYVTLLSCDEDWACTGWSSCSAGVQARTCLDRNYCGTELHEPSLSQTCISGSAGGVSTGVITASHYFTIERVETIDAMKGETLSIPLTVRNAGSYNEENVTLSLACPEGWSCGSAFVESINMSESLTVYLPVRVSADAAPGNYTVVAAAENGFYNFTSDVPVGVLSECRSDTECGKDRVCVSSRCYNLFDLSILRVDTPVRPDDQLDFTYSLKNMATVSGDFVLDYWLQDGTQNVLSGSKTFYVSSGQQRTEDGFLYLPGTLPVGTYDFYLRLSSKDYSVVAYTPIEVTKEPPLVLDARLDMNASYPDTGPVGFTAIVSSNKDSVVVAFLNEKIMRGVDVVWRANRTLGINRSASIVQTVRGLAPGTYWLELSAASGSTTASVQQSFTVSADVGSMLISFLREEWWVLVIAGTPLAAILAIWVAGRRRRAPPVPPQLSGGKVPDHAKHASENPRQPAEAKKENPRTTLARRAAKMLDAFSNPGIGDALDQHTSELRKAVRRFNGEWARHKQSGNLKLRYAEMELKKPRTVDVDHLKGRLVQAARLVMKSPSKVEPDRQMEESLRKLRMQEKKTRSEEQRASKRVASDEKIQGTAQPEKTVKRIKQLMRKILRAELEEQ